MLSMYIFTYSCCDFWRMNSWRDIAGLLNKHILSLYIYWQATFEKAIGIYIPTDSAPELISSLSPIQRLSIFLIG